MSWRNSREAHAGRIARRARAAARGARAESIPQPKLVEDPQPPKPPRLRRLRVAMPAAAVLGAVSDPGHVRAVLAANSGCGFPFYDRVPI